MTYNIPSIKRGSRKVQEKPKTEFLYRTLRSEIAKFRINDLLFHNSCLVEINFIAYSRGFFKTILGESMVFKCALITIPLSEGEQ